MMSNKNHLGPVLPRSLVDYHRITQDLETAPIHTSHTRAGKLFAKMKSLVTGIFGLLHSIFSKKAEPTSILIGDEATYSLLDRVQLPLSAQDMEVDQELDYKELPNLQKALNLVRADRKTITEVRKQLPRDSEKSVHLSMEYSARIESLDTLERMLTDAILILEEKYKHTYVADLQKVKDLQFEGYAPGFINVRQEAVDKFLMIVTGEKRTDSIFNHSDYPEEIIPLLVNIDTLARVVAIWNEYPNFEEVSGFSKSQIALIRGMVENYFGKKTPIFNLEFALSKAPLLFMSEEAVLEIVSKMAANEQSSLSEAERRMYQLIILQLPMLESSGKYAAIVKGIKDTLKPLNSFSDFRSYFEKEFFPLSTLNQLYSNNLLFEIFYVAQDRFSSLPLEERTKKTILERSSVFLQSPIQEIESEKPVTSINVDGETVGIPDEIDGWLDKGYTIRINGEVYAKAPNVLVNIYKALKKIATHNDVTDQSLLRSLLTVVGFGSEPKIRTEIAKAADLLGKDYQVYIKELTLPKDLYIDISVQSNGSIKVESAFAYLLVDNSGNEDRVLPQKIKGKQEFTLTRDDEIYVKANVQERLFIEDMSQDDADDDYVSQLQIANTNMQAHTITDLPATVRDRIAIQDLILDEMIADLSYRSTLDSDVYVREKQDRYVRRLAEMTKSPIFIYSMTAGRFDALLSHLPQDLLTIAFRELEEKYKPIGKDFLNRMIEAFRKEQKDFNVKGFEEDITKHINIPGKALIYEKSITDLHRREEDIDTYIRRDGQSFILKQKTEKSTEKRYFDNLLKAMGEDSDWLKPVSAFYSQLLPNQMASGLIGSAMQEASQPENTQLIFGTNCYFFTEHARSEITVRELSDSKKEVICKDFFKVKLGPNSLVSGIEIVPDGDLYFETRIILEKSSKGEIEVTDSSISFSMDGKTPQPL